MKDGRPTDPPPHTLESKEQENQRSRMQGNQSNAENFGSQECKQKEKSSHTGKIRNQKNKIKYKGLAGEFGQGDPVDRQRRATCENYLSLTKVTC